MTPLLLAGSGNAPLAAALAARAGWELGETVLDRFPDGELQVEVQADVRARDVYILEALRPPAEHYLMELLLLADAARRAGAQRLTAVIPYLAYARQDRRRLGREPLGARVVADLLQSVGFDRVVALDLHSEAVEGTFRVPLEHVSPIEQLVEHLRRTLPRSPIIVSPDLGGVRRAERFARLLRLPVAIAHKSRLSGAEVIVRGIVGDVKGCSPIVVDDMISTGATLEATVEALLEAGAARDVTVVVTHALLVGPATERLRRLPVKRLVTTDSLPVPAGGLKTLETVSVAPLLAETLVRLHAQAGGSPGRLAPVRRRRVPRSRPARK